MWLTRVDLLILTYLAIGAIWVSLMKEQAKTVKDFKVGWILSLAGLVAWPVMIAIGVHGVYIRRGRK